MTEPTQQPNYSDPKINSLLSHLVTEDYKLLMKGAKLVPLKFRRRLFLQDAPVDVVYFPLTCMLSLLVTTAKQPQMELATTGREGVIGASELLLGQGSIGLSLVQIPGLAVRIPADAFLAHIRSRPEIEKLLQQHQYALTRQILQGVACNRIHSMEERCARWLLMMHDQRSV